MNGAGADKVLGMRWIGGVPAAASPHPDPPHQGEGTPARLINLPFINGKVLGRAQSCSRPSGARSRGGLGQNSLPLVGRAGVGAVSQAPALRGKATRRAGPNSLPLVGRAGVGGRSVKLPPSGARSRGGLVQTPSLSWGGLGWGRSVKLPPSGARPRGGLVQTPSPSWGGSGWGANTQLSQS